MTLTLPQHLIGEKPTEGITACRLCGDTDEMAINIAIVYGRMVPGADVCAECAERVANAFYAGSRGVWFSYPNPDPAPPLKKKIPNALRKAVFERDAYRCKHCGTHLNLSIDHIHPESRGGETVLENLQTLCHSCNASKGVNV